MLEVPDPEPSVCIGSDVLVRLGAQLDTVHQMLLSHADIGLNVLSGDASQMMSNQTIPQACQLVNKFDVVVPAQTAGVPVKLVLIKGLDLQNAKLAISQPSVQLRDIGLSVRGNTQLEINNCASYLFVHNLTRYDIPIPTYPPLGYLINRSFHDFELTVPVIGELPDLPRKGDICEQVYVTRPIKMIAIIPHPSWDGGTVCRLQE